MKLYKPNFWSSKKNLLTILLLPLSLVFLLITVLKKKITKEIEFKIPIICVGNIYVGGTGKTPLSIYLAKNLTQLGKRPAIIRKYYKDHKDEQNMIKSNFENLFMNTDRSVAINEAMNKKLDAVIMDDGYQDYKIKKDLKILCFNSNQLIGNGLVLPSGPLREKFSSVKEAHLAVINGEKNIDFEQKLKKMNNLIEIFYTRYKAKNIDEFKNKKLLAISGIGNPENFFKLLVENNINLEKKLFFPDHYQFSKKEMDEITDEANKKNYQIVMTEKDYFRIKDFKLENIKYLKVELDIEKKEKFIKKILEIYD